LFAVNVHLHACIGLRLVVHGTSILVTEMCSSIHRETASSTTKSVSLGSVFPGIALLAEDLSVVFSEDCGVEFLVAKSTLETLLVELATGSENFLSSVYALTALRALEGFWGLERHLYLTGLGFAFPKKS